MWNELKNVNASMQVCIHLKYKKKIWVMMVMVKNRGIVMLNKQYKCKLLIFLVYWSWILTDRNVLTITGLLVFWDGSENVVHLQFACVGFHAPRVRVCDIYVDQIGQIKTCNASAKIPLSLHQTTSVLLTNNQSHVHFQNKIKIGQLQCT